MPCPICAFPEHCETGGCLFEGSWSTGDKKAQVDHWVRRDTERRRVIENLEAVLRRCMRGW
jgi:hypothetical protein